VTRFRPQSFFARAKKLKAASINRSLDHVARKLVWRITISRHGPYRTPWLELARQMKTG
jgi:hypothetical protein